MSNVLPIDVAQYIIDFFKKANKDITTIKLQKLVFYSQVWSLVWDDEPLFDEDFEAWVNGPVVVSLFHKLKGFYFCPSEVVSANIERLSSNQKDTIDHVIEYYGSYSSSELVQLTHSEEPWMKAREGLSTGEPSHNIISKEELLNFYMTQQSNE